MIEDDDFPHSQADVVMLPPNDTAGTDEDSGEEDNMSPDNLPRNQLRALAEIHVNHDDEYDSEDDLPLARFVNKNKERRPPSKIQRSYHWTDGDIIQESENWQNDEEDANEELPTELFFKLFDENIFELLSQESNRYAAMNNKIGKCVTIREMKAYVAILILSGYVPYPRRKMFWEKDKDVHNILVSQALSRDRFDFIMSILHMADNNHLDNSDKFGKVRPLFNALNRNFLKYAKLEENHSIDEAMVPYFGRHGCKQFIKGKPIRWGYKLWVGCTKNGYINWFEPYQGASTHISPQYREYGVGAGVVLTYVDALRNRWEKESFHLFFDNFFSGMVLFESLSQRNIRATGTIRSNRITQNPLKTTKEMKNQTRGSYDSKVDIEKNIIVVSWHDNSIVSLCSNSLGINPIRLVKRYSQQEKKSISIPQPSLVRMYNQNMGGVDRSDQNISLYRTGIRGKKWYFCLFTHCVDMAIQNAWQLHRRNKGTLDQLAFRRRIATSILNANTKNKTYAVGRPSNRENTDSRFDGICHYVIPQDRQTKCRHCHMKTTTKCQKCDVGIHVRCFVDYHTDSNA